MIEAAPTGETKTSAPADCFESMVRRRGSVIGEAREEAGQEGDGHVVDE